MEKKIRVISHHKKPTTLSLKEVQMLLPTIKKWDILHGTSLYRSFSFKNFKDALEFVNRVADLADKEDHHPDIYLSWGKVEIQLTTHSIKGLSDRDIILAEAIDKIA